MDNEINIPLMGTVTAGTAWALACRSQISCIRTSTSSLYVDDVDGAIVRRFARPAKNSWWIHSMGWKTKSAHFQSQYVCADTHGSSSSCCRISAKLWSANRVLERSTCGLDIWFVCQRYRHGCPTKFKFSILNMGWKGSGGVLSTSGKRPTCLWRLCL